MTAQMPSSEIESLYRIEKFMASMTDLDKLLEVIMQEGASATNAESSSVALHDEAADELYFFVARGHKEEREFEKKLKCIRMEMGTGVVGWCAEHRQAVNIADVARDPRFSRKADEATGFVTRSILAVPMQRRGKVIGVVEVVNKQAGDGFSPHDEKVLTVLAAQAALVIENARLVEENIRQARLSALGQGIAGAAHCIKNILNGIVGGAFILDMGISQQKTEHITRGWDIVKRNTKIMQDLILDMLTYSRPRKPECEPGDINIICRDVAELMRENAAKKNVQLALELQQDIGEVVLDPKGIYRCILNLVSNAIDACDKPDGKVRVVTRAVPPGNGVEVTIADNGCGIKEENLKNLFKVFFSTKGSKGTGLGLAVTQKIITEHGGAIRAESTLGAGTSFIITLPRDATKQGQ